jgi:hypothetical protein
MTERRPRRYADTPQTLPVERQLATTQRDVTALDASVTALDASVTALDASVTALDGRVDAVEASISGLPDAGDIWATDRPTSQFGTGADTQWTATGDGSTVTFAIAGRLSTNSARYRVTVGGVLQTPDKFTIGSPSATITFVEAPPSGVDIHIFAPFYGA